MYCANPFDIPYTVSFLSSSVSSNPPITWLNLDLSLKGFFRGISSKSAGLDES